MAKKSFTNNLNPAMSFISSPVEEQPTLAKPPEGYKVNPQYIEKKTRRLQLVLQPSLYERVKARAEQSGSSVNDYIHSILEEATREE